MKKIDYYEGICVVCKAETKTTQEVMRVPRAFGGDVDDYRGNYQSMCSECYTRKKELERDLFAFETDESDRREWLHLAFQCNHDMMRAFVGEMLMSLHHFEELLAGLGVTEVSKVTR